MNTEYLDECYNLYIDSPMVCLDIPPVCCNRVCKNWSSPRYCYEKFISGLEYYPVCVRSAIQFNRKLLPLPKVKVVKPKFVQLELF